VSGKCASAFRSHTGRKARCVARRDSRERMQEGESAPFGSQQHASMIVMALCSLGLRA